MSVLGVYNPLDIDVDHGDGVYTYSCLLYTSDAADE